MKFVFLSALTVSALCGAATAASATSASIAYGSDWAVSCYRSAEARLANERTLAVCTQAINDENVTFDDLVATYVNRGIIHLLSGRDDQATADFDTAIRLRNDMAEAWLNKGVSGLNLGRSAEALQYAQKALDLQVENQALAYFVRGLAREDSGDIAAAYSDLMTAQRLAPAWKEPKVELARYRVVRKS